MRNKSALLIVEPVDVHLVRGINIQIEGHMVTLMDVPPTNIIFSRG